MNKKQKNRVLAITCIVILLSLAIGLVLFALKQNINLFYTPTDLQSARLQPEQTIRIGGYVKKNSVRYDASGQNVHFVVTDNKHDIAVNYRGLLPNLFREGQGVVIEGKIQSANTVEATEVLAKHDEKYMPKIFEKN